MTIYLIKMVHFICIRVCLTGHLETISRWVLSRWILQIGRPDAMELGNQTGRLSFANQIFSRTLLNSLNLQRLKLDLNLRQVTCVASDFQWLWFLKRFGIHPMNFIVVHQNLWKHLLQITPSNAIEWRSFDVSAICPPIQTRQYNALVWSVTKFDDKTKFYLFYDCILDLCGLNPLDSQN